MKILESIVYVMHCAYPYTGLKVESKYVDNIGSGA